MSKASVSAWYQPSDLEITIWKLIGEYGGTVNAHAHLDRANTNLGSYWSHAGINPNDSAILSLKAKQSRVGELHKGVAYTRDDLEKRMTAELKRAISCGTKKITTLVDATPDIGLVAVEVALQLKKRFEGQIDLRVGTQPIFGFKNPEVNPDRWEIFVEASRSCDVIGALPEKDDEFGKIGYDQHLIRVLQLGIELGKEVHIHVDQANDPSENGTETLTQAVRWLGSPKIKGQNGPSVWAVHAISPSCYDERRFYALLENMAKYNIGVICCPRAAVTMRQLRPISAPVHNCVARILEMVKFGIPVRIGTDNVSDIFMPSGDWSILKELIILGDLLRYADASFLAKLGCGITLNDTDRDKVGMSLMQDQEVFRELTK